LEYEDVAKRLVGKIPLTARDIDDILDYICQVANRRKIYYLWRPFLSDPDDDMVLELAVAAECDFIITFNQSDFQGIELFGIDTITPREFLQKIGALP
jgi:predicted nucleic acid-binding protein